MYSNFKLKEKLMQCWKKP